MNLWHDVDDSRITEDDFVAVVEIKKGSKNKYELDKQTGALILDRILYTSTHYPANYGFIPRTLTDDNDPLDVLLISSEAVDSLALVRCYPIGVVRMRDGHETDDKIIAIAFGDPINNHVRDICGLSSHIIDEIMHFFHVYKQLEGKKTGEIQTQGLSCAKQIIASAKEQYHQKFGKK